MPHNNKAKQNSHASQPIAEYKRVQTTEELERHRRTHKLRLAFREYYPEVRTVRMTWDESDTSQAIVFINGQRYYRTFSSFDNAYEVLIEERQKLEMSIENHPNFHAVGFVVDLITSVNERLRGAAPAVRKQILARLHPAFLSITEQVEQTIDYVIEEEKGKENGNNMARQKGELPKEEKGKANAALATEENKTNE